MTSNAVNFQGRLSASSKRVWRVQCRGWLALLFGMLFATNALADNVLQDIAFAPLPGGQVQVTLKFSGPVSEPRIFATENPARIAVDMADTRNALTQRRIDVNSGATAAISAVEAGGRTRVVIDLMRPSSYETKAQGNTFLLTISNGMGSGSAT